MSILFSHFFQKINTISPLETNFTEVLDTIALKPKMLYFYGKMPKNMLKTVKSSAKSSANSGPKKTIKTSNFAPNSAPKAINSEKTVNSASLGVISARPKTVAIVGTRHNTRYGYDVAYNLAYKLAEKGVVIVSGLAFGIDSIAHKACLDAGGVTVAVLGTPIDDIYPREHFSLAERILKQDGAILSEYAPRTEEYKNAPLGYGEIGFKNGVWYSPETANFQENPVLPPYEERRVETHYSFLRRNRLISGLADVVVVIEAAERSGSLNTATHALNQGKEVFAVPGNITNPYSRGCNKLIAQGANPYTESKDILRLLFPEDYKRKTKTASLAKNLIGDSPAETLILRALASGLRSGDEIMQKTGLSPDLFNQSVTLLEIKGRLASLGANNWTLC